MIFLFLCVISLKIGILSSPETCMSALDLMLAGTTHLIFWLRPLYGTGHICGGQISIFFIFDESRNLITGKLEIFPNFPVIKFLLSSKMKKNRNLTVTNVANNSQINVECGCLRFRCVFSRFFACSSWSS